MALEYENRELRQANEILSKASAYFVQAELDCRFRPSLSSMTTAGLGDHARWRSWPLSAGWIGSRHWLHSPDRLTAGDSH